MKCFLISKSEYILLLKVDFSYTLSFNSLLQNRASRYAEALNNFALLLPSSLFKSGSIAVWYLDIQF